MFEVVFPPGETPNILLEESQPGNKVSEERASEREIGVLVQWLGLLFSVVFCLLLGCFFSSGILFSTMI